MPVKRQKFQYNAQFLNKLIVSIITDQRFLLKAIDLQVDSYIESQPHEWLVKFIFDFYKDYKVMPTMDSIRVKIQQKKQPLFKQSLSTTFISVLNAFQQENLEFVKDTVINFCRFQQLKKAITQSIDYLQEQNFEQIYDLINKTRYKGMETDFGVQYVSSFEDRYTQQSLSWVETPWKVVNNVLRGGLRQTKLGVILAPPGVGKSWVLCNLATHAIKTGKKVIYYSLEMTEQEIGSRVDSMLCKKPVQYIEMKANWDKVKKLIEPYRDNLRIKQFLPNMTKVGDIQNHMNQLVLFQKFDPDLIIVDYGDILKKESSLNDLYTAYGDAYTNLKRVAKQYRKAVWTASQGNRCLALDTIVQLKDKSQIKIQDVKVGDQLVSINGANKVVSIYHDKQPIYQIKLKNGKTIKCSANHMFPSNNGSLKSIESGLTVNNILYYKNNKKISEIQIQNIQLQDIQETIDIEVQGNHLFFANDILTHNSSINSQFVLGDDIAHSLGKLEIADFVLSMSRKQQDKMSDTARFVVVKNRSGRDGNVYNAIVDFDIGSIQIFDNFTQNSIETRKKMDNNDKLMKQTIKERLQILRKNKEQQENKI